ncbi:MAG: glycosyltransferase [Rhodospirillales bacterium]|nr:glycosyltransferase [Rhodospirillales bacterium]
MEPVKIYVNGRFLAQPLTGVQRFALQIFKAIDGMTSLGSQLNKEFSFEVLTPRDAIPPKFKNITARPVGVLRSHLWDQLELPMYARSGLLLSLCGAGPVLHREHIVAIHDAAIFANPRNFSLPYRAVHGALAPALVRAAKGLVTVSHFSRKELARYCPSTAKKMGIVPNGADHILADAADPAVLDAHHLRRGRYVLALGSLSPSKNIRLATAAIAELADLDLRLVVAGGSSRVFSSCAVDRGPGVVWLGRVSDGAVRALYENALCFVFPSLYEGFGIPSIEAMLCGCPVVASDIPALRETCGEAALYCDPHEPKSLAAQIRALACDPDLRSKLRTLGLARARGFSWNRSAELLLDTLREVRGSSAPHCQRLSHSPVRKRATPYQEWRLAGCMTKTGFNMADYENNIIAVNDDATSKTLPSLIADLRIRNDWAWSQDHFADTAMKIIRNFSVQEVCELGGGRAPFLSRDFVNDTGVRYVVNDVSASELERAPSWIERGLFDIAAPEVPPQFRCRFDFIFSKMLLEHVHDGKAAHANVFSMLRPGGIYFHFHPVLFSPAISFNRLMPEWMTRRVLRLLQPCRHDDGCPKFPARYSYCFVNEATKGMLCSLGFREVALIPFYGNDYLKRFPYLQSIEDIVSRYAMRTNKRYLASLCYSLGVR